MSSWQRVADEFDWWLFGAAAGLALVSGLAMASAASTVHAGLAMRHWGWTAAGMLLSIAVARLNYRTLSEYAGLIYGLSLAALVAVELAGAVRLGAARWLSIFGFSVQPSELAKLATVWLLARHLAGQGAVLPNSVVWASLAIAGVPAVLIFIQPDLGSATIFGAIWLGIVWVAGIRGRLLAGLAGAALAAAPLAWHLLKGYQRDRLLAFINPHADPLGAGYTIIQSTIAIGSGRLWGRGWFAGTQNQLSFLPERHSDFIFSVIGEEWGWLGCVAVIALFGLLLFRVLRLAMASAAPQGQLLAVGIFSWIAYQACVNMGMVMGLLPVVGVPLPLVSYGGSSMVVVWLALGLLQSVRRADREV